MKIKDLQMGDMFSISSNETKYMVLAITKIPIYVINLDTFEYETFFITDNFDINYLSCVTIITDIYASDLKKRPHIYFQDLPIGAFFNFIDITSVPYYLKVASNFYIYLLDQEKNSIFQGSYLTNNKEVYIADTYTLQTQEKNFL